MASLHALAYCERLFYLEEVERLRLADAAVYSGRRLHVEIAKDEGDTVQRLEFEDGELGIRGAVDVLRVRSGELIRTSTSAGSPPARRSTRGMAERSDPDRRIRDARRGGTRASCG